MSVALANELAALRVDPDGVIRIGATRVTFDTLVAAYHEGLTVEEIAEQYPTLRLADIHLAIGYLLNHSDEVDAYLRRRQAFAATVRAENEKRSSPEGIRDRLLARRK